jgi:hypothetical protein
MRRVLVLSLVVMVASVFMATSVLAEKPGPVMDKSNGFPSGEHFNLNIIGKKDGFNPHEEQTDGTTDSYGNVVFVPENGEGAIYMESGKGKKFEEVLQLRVLDNWAGDADGARLQLPKNEAGYRVYARALGKPGDRDLTSIGLTPGLGLVQDENGNDLYYLGLVTDGGFETSYQEFERRKGKSKAIDISGLFKWYGEICYFFEEDPGEGYYTKEICCVDMESDECVRYGVVGEEDVVCLEGSDPVIVYCKDYTTDPVPWIFNIAEFVEYLWSTNNNGTKLLSVRFYPN